LPEPTPEPTPQPADPTAQPTPDPAGEPTPIDPPASPDPAASLDPAASPDPSGDPGASPSPDPSVEPSPTATPEPGGLSVTHTWIDTVSDKGAVTRSGDQDAPVTDAKRYTVYRVRFQLLNDGETAVTLKPELQVQHRDVWQPLPEMDPRAGVPFYAAADDGKRFRKRDSAIAPDELRLTSSDDQTATAAEGVASAGRNPAPTLNLPAHSFTEVEFAVRATADADWERGYDFRLVDGDGTLDAAVATTIRLGAKPAVKLSPGQREGEEVAVTLPLYALDPWGIDAPTNGVALKGSFARLSTPLAAGGPFTSPHMDYTLSTDACAACHSTHRAQAPMLVGPAAPVANVCFSCHDGSGAVADVEAEFTDPSVPANDESTDSWYSHPAALDVSHRSDREDEFGGTLDRHAACADCHQPHNSDASRPSATTAGWTAAGSIKGASGVAVVNGGAGSVPTYTLQNVTDLEYQLCFKCHSSFTDLPANDPARPSRWSLDKALELNPANVSYHPVEAPGKNESGQMAASLAGTSPYKLWNFDTTSTIRCLNCHGDSDLANPASPPDANAVLDNHAGPIRGILIAPYRDRQLLGSVEPYDPEDAALCLSCHAEGPFVDTSGDFNAETNFPFHGLHTSDIKSRGTGGTDIDVDGAGQGNATCAECHFRTHSTALPVDGQPPAAGLVNFAPNIKPYDGPLNAYQGRFEFRAATPTSYGSCTLTCHGKPHANYVYVPEP
jgi:predicted CXXCH cytochrome family protein